MAEAGRRVLQLLGPSTGGIRRHVSVLADALTERGWEVGVAGPAGVMEGRVPAPAVVPVPTGLRLGAALAARRALAPLAGRVDVVHAHGLKAAWVAASLPRPSWTLVASVHNLVLGHSAGSRALRALEARLPARVDRVVAVSSEIARRFSGRVGADRVVVIPPVGPPPRPTRSRDKVRADLGLSPGQPLVVTAARLHPQKGLDTLLLALDRLRRRVPDVRAVVLGEGPLEEELADQACSLGLEAVLDLAGPRASVADELAAADVVVVSSRWESGPLVVFEALALERPVVSTAVGMAPELVVDGVTGRLVPPGDPGALAEAVGDVLADPAGAAAMAAAGRRVVEERLDPGALVGAIEALYGEVAR